MRLKSGVHSRSVLPDFFLDILCYEEQAGYQQINKKYNAEVSVFTIISTVSTAPFSYLRRGNFRKIFAFL